MKKLRIEVRESRINSSLRSCDPLSSSFMAPHSCHHLLLPLGQSRGTCKPGMKAAAQCVKEELISRGASKHRGHEHRQWIEPAQADENAGGQPATLSGLLTLLEKGRPFTSPRGVHTCVLSSFLISTHCACFRVTSTVTLPSLGSGRPGSVL